MKTILKFYSPTCGPCKALGENLKQLTDEVNIVEVDTMDPKNVDMILKYNVRSVPTIIILDENEETVANLRGIVTIDRIKEALS